MFKTEAIILSKRKYSDNSFIVTFYSLAKGVMSVFVRIPKIKAANIRQNLFFPLNIIDCEIDFKATRHIQTFRYCNRQIVLKNICSNIYKTCIAQFIAEVVLKSVKEEEANPALYKEIKSTVILLEDSQDFMNLHLAFLNKFSKLLGFGITNNFCPDFPYFNLKEGMFLPVFTTDDASETESNSKIFAELINLDLDNYNNIIIKKKHKQIFLNIIIRYYKYHLHGNFDNKSLDILMTICG
jgi:DNA repair protein RecO (recombination protein O)